MDMPIEVKSLPIVREQDGVAMSSRNTYLSLKEREAALILNRSLKNAKEMIESGEKDAKKIRSTMVAMIEEESLARIDYVSIVSANTLLPIERLSGQILIALAVFIGKTRLIDNIIVEAD